MMSSRSEISTKLSLAPGGAIVRGDWSLHATMAVEPAQNIRPLPEDGRLGTTTFHFTSIVKSGPSLQVGGPLASHLTDTIGPDIPNVSKPHPGFNVRLLDANGTEVQGLSRDASSGPGTETTNWRWLITAPGRYRLIASFEGASQFEREIKVPSQR